MAEHDTTETRDPAEIEADIRRTQQEMGRTVNQIEDQFTPRNMMNGLLDKAEENGIDARYLLDGARRNPIALGMIALGGIWLISGSDARPSSLKPSGLGKSENDETHGDFHRGYVEHMNRCEPQTDEDDAAYRRRRALARANYLMIEQRHDEDETSFKERLDQATDKLRDQRDSMLHAAQDMGRSARGSARDLSSKAASLYRGNPMVGGAIAALAGAIAGAALPATRTEEEQFGSLGAKALDAATGKAHELGDMAMEKKDMVVEELTGSDNR